jgi:DNA-binding response OmpR family regulator
VDDEPGILATLGAILELHDLQVVTAPSAERATRLLESNRFDLVITDTKMESDKAGYTVVEAARHSSGTPPTLIISGCSGLAEDWEEHGAAAMLTKPTHVPELLAMVDRLLEHPITPKSPSPLAAGPSRCLTATSGSAPHGPPFAAQRN